MVTTAELQAEFGVALASDGTAAGTPGTYGGTCLWTSGDGALYFTLSTDPWSEADAQNWEWARERARAHSVTDLGDEALWYPAAPGTSNALIVRAGDVVLGFRVSGEGYSGTPEDAERSLTALARLALARL